MKPKRVTYEDTILYEWILPVKKGYRMKCCNCGLVHVFNFRIKDGQIEYQVVKAYKRKP